MNKILRCICLLIYLSVSSVMFAQKTDIKGKIVGKNDLLPLTGATISVKGKSIHTVSDLDGNFTITASSPQDVLQVRYLGFVTQEVQIQGKNQITIILEENQTTLDEVVVIGYGSAKRSDLTGAVGSVNLEDFTKASVPSMVDALAGRVAGVQVNSTDGQPGASSNIVVRGVSSITQETSPLYVIDGFPVEDFDNNSLNPADIESIEVLKDASATAIYGSRGGNGVIIVTTKQGKIGLPKISYDFYSGLQTEVNRYQLMNPYEFVKYQLELNPATTRYTNEEQTLESYKDVKGIDWQDHAMQTGILQSHSLSISGGDSKTKYLVSGSYLNQKGLLLNSGFKRYQGRIVLDLSVNSNLKVGVNLNLSSTEKFGAVANSSGDNGSSTLNVMYSILGYRPVSGGGVEFDDILLEDPTDPDVNPASDYRFNPVLSLKNEYNPAFNSSLLGNSYAEYKLSKNLTFRSTVGITKKWYKQEIFNNTNTRDGSPTMPQGANGMNGSVVHSESLNFLNENTLTYKKTIKAHSFNVLAGYTFQKYNAAVDGFSANQVPNADLRISGLDEGVPDRIRASSTLNGLESYLSRINYNYKFKYYLTASFRADGSSKFAKGNKWAYFPSGSFAWRMSKENFFNKSYLKFVNDAKLRIGYGSTGNNRVSDFAYRSSLFVSGYGYGFNNGAIPAAYPQALGNKDIKWESSTMINGGVDLSFFKGKIDFTADIYHKNTTDLLLNASLNPSSGYINAFKNIGEIVNQGLELKLNTVNIRNKNFSWTSNFNISFNKNRVVALNENQVALLTNVRWSSNFNNTTPYIAKPGMPVAMFYGFIFDGIYQYEDFNSTSSGGYLLKDEIPNNGNARTAVQPGDIKYKDINGDGQVNSDDRTVIGNPNPIHIGGFSNNFTYKGFDLNVFLQWSYGNDLLNANRIEFEGGSARTSLNQFASFQNRWSPENPSNEHFRANGQGPSVYSSKIIEDGSYLKLKTITLGYNLPDKFTSMLNISRLRLYVSAQNIFTWTEYSGIDPDVSVRPSALTPGFDWSAYPSAKTITIGLNLNL